MKPINKIAAMGMSIGEHYKPYMRKIQAPHWENRPRLSPIPTTFYDYYNNFEDLTGQRFGRLDVVGYKRTHHSRNNPWHWICRCDCGMYVGKSTKALKRQERSTAVKFAMLKDGPVILKSSPRPRKANNGSATTLKRC